MPKIQARHHLMGIIFLVYIASIVLLCLYSNIGKGVNIFAFGVSLSSLGCLLTYYCIFIWEKSFPAKQPAPPPIIIREEKIVEVPTPVVEKTYIQDPMMEQQIEMLAQDLNKQTEQFNKLYQEYQELKRAGENTKQEFMLFRDVTTQQLDRKESLLVECQNTIAEQRTLIQKKQQQILRLEGKIRDLNYDVKTLLELNDIEEDIVNFEPNMDHLESEEIKINSPEFMLQRCIDKARKITGTSHFVGKETSFDTNILDSRHLVDHFRDDPCALMVYDRKNDRFLFANSSIKNLLGWSPDKVTKEFYELLQNNKEWKRALDSLNSKNDVSAKLVIKNRDQEEMAVSCHLGIIPSGIFSGNVIILMQNF